MTTSTVEAEMSGWRLYNTTHSILRGEALLENFGPRLIFSLVGEARVCGSTNKPKRDSHSSCSFLFHLGSYDDDDDAHIIFTQQQPLRQPPPWRLLQKRQRTQLRKRMLRRNDWKQSSLMTRKTTCQERQAPTM